MSSSGILPKGASRDQYGTFNNAQEEVKEGGQGEKKTGWFAAYTTVPSHGWSPLWYFTNIKGSEWFHLYLWMAKDLAWTQNWFWFGMITGSLAVLWSVFLLVQSIVRKHYVETWHYVAQLLWLSANWWWMFGELHDSEFPHEEVWYPSHTIECGLVLLVAICWLGIYYLALKHLKVLPAPPKETLEAYDEGSIELHPWAARLFSSWREYENIHILLWLAKDTAWNHSWPIIWWVFAIPTVAIALDFAVTTSFYRGMAVHHVHYKVQFLWVIANLVWAYGEIFIPEHDKAVPLFSFGDESWVTMRWYSAWILVVAFVVVIIFNIVWIILTLMGHAEDAKEGEGETAEDGENSSGYV